MSEKLSSAKPTSLKTNIVYALSDVACNPIYSIMLVFLVYFYTDVVGIDPCSATRFLRNRDNETEKKSKKYF